MNSSLNIEKIRLDTPACQKIIHLNNAGAALQPNSVLQAQQDYFQLEKEIGGYEAMMDKADEITKFYSNLSILLNCEPLNIAHATSATDAYTKALSSISFKKGDIILTTDDDYVSNQFAFLVLKKRFGVEIIRAKKLKVGGVDVQSMADLIKKHQPKLVAVTHIPTNSGLIQDIEAIGEICNKENILYLVDACQSAGQMPLDVTKIHCDFLTATFRKFMRGPRGIGFLFVSDKVLKMGLEPVFPDLTAGQWIGADDYQLDFSAKKFETWERNYSLVMGAIAATQYALNLGLETIEKRVQYLSDYTREAIEKLPGWQVLDKGKRKGGIVTCHAKNIDLVKLKAAFVAANINVTFPTKTNAFIDFDEKGVDWAVRIAPHYYNVLTEIDKTIEILNQSS